MGMWAMDRLTMTGILLVSMFLAGSAFAASDKPITGAGAHFAWTIFDELKPDLERKVKRPIILYGKNSMLGQGCNAGIKMARKHTPDNETFGFLCCPLEKEEQKKEDVMVFPLALEPIAILTNGSNPVSNLSQKQIRAIFSGRITNWKQVGGKNQPIVVVTRLHCKSRPGHWKRILPSEKHFTSRRINVKSDDEMVQRLTDFEGAIGYAGTTWTRQPGLKVKSVSVDRSKPTAANLKNKSYPFYRLLSAVTVRDPSPDVVRILREVQIGKAFQRVADKYELLRHNRIEH